MTILLTALGIVFVVTLVLNSVNKDDGDLSFLDDCL